MIILSFTDERGGFSMNLLTENEIQDLGIHQVSYIDAKEIKYYQWVRDLCEENKNVATLIKTGHAHLHMGA